MKTYSLAHGSPGPNPNYIKSYRIKKEECWSFFKHSIRENITFGTVANGPLVRGVVWYFQIDTMNSKVFLKVIYCTKFEISKNVTSIF